MRHVSAHLRNRFEAAAVVEDPNRAALTDVPCERILWVDDHDLLAGRMQLLASMSRPELCNALLLAEAGTGKTALVQATMLVDPDRRIIKAYGAAMPILGRTLRVTYVIDSNRRVLGAFHHELSAAKHLSDVKHALEAAKS